METKQANPESTTEAFARRMRRYREKRRWSQEDLARELTVAGWKVDRTQIARIESRHRGIALDEALMIAWVLSVPPALLYLPLGDADEVAITPNEKLQPIRALQWVTGDVDQSFGIVRDSVTWATDMALWWLYDSYVSAVKQVWSAKTALKDAEASEVGIGAARVEHVRALRTLADRLDEIRSQKLALPALDETIAGDLEKVTA